MLKFKKTNIYYGRSTFSGEICGLFLSLKREERGGICNERDERREGFYQ